MKTNFNNKTYNEGFKENAVAKLLSPGSQGLNATARKVGVAPSTLYGWKKKYASKSSMKKNETKVIKAKNWSSEKKLKALMDTASMDENDLGAYLRREGLYSSDLNTFKKEFISSDSSKGRPNVDPEVKELRKQKNKLEHNIKRKDKALAEYSARVILLKKSHEIWGDPEDDE